MQKALKSLDSRLERCLEAEAGVSGAAANHIAAVPKLFLGGFQPMKNASWLHVKETKVWTGATALTVLTTWRCAYERTQVLSRRTTHLARETIWDKEAVWQRN